MAHDQDGGANAAPPPAPQGARGRRALLLINTHSRRADELLEQVLKRLEAAQDLHVVLRDCHEPDTLSRIIIEHRDRVDMVIVGGGDGTMNAAGKGLIETGLPLGVLPLGTANDLARTLGIPEDLDAAVDVILAGRERLIDVGEVNGRPFFNVASIGLSVDLARALTRDLKRRFGRLGYLIAAIKVLMRARPFRATIETGDGRVRVRTLQIAVGNGLFYGGGMEVAHGATIDDAMLNLYSLEVRRIWTLPLMARAFKAGRHGAWRDVRVSEAEAFTVTTRRPRAINADGEIIGYTPATFAVRPRAVRVFAPAIGPGTAPPLGQPTGTTV